MGGRWLQVLISKMAGQVGNGDVTIVKLGGKYHAKQDFGFNGRGF